MTTRSRPTVFFEAERTRYPNTGLHSFCLELFEALLAESNEVFDFRFFGASSVLRDHPQLEPYLIPVRPINRIPIPFTGKQQLTPLSQLKVDLAHVTFQSSYYFRFPYSKTLLTVHDLNFLHEEGKSARRIARSRSRVKQRVDHADKVVFISEFAKNDCEAQLGSIEGSKVILNGCAFDQNSEEKRPEAVPSRFLLALGTINAKKNFHTLVPLVAEDLTLTLVLAGVPNDSYVEKINRYAGELGVQKQVKILGPVTAEEKRWLYAHCEAFLFPSLAEGFGLPPLEAMSYGKPTFLSTRTSLPEIGGPLAYYFASFTPGDMTAAFQEGMAHYQADPGLADKIRDHAHQFRWETCAKQYLQEYERLLGGA